MRLVLIGPGDTEYHFTRLLGMKESEYWEHVKGIARALSSTRVEIGLLPDRGVPVHVAREYKKTGGKKCIALAPLSDRTFGTKHLEPFLQEEGLFDETVDTGDWYKHDLIIGLMGDALLYLGTSLGSAGELAYAGYLYKLVKGAKPGVAARVEKIHPLARAGTRFPYTVIAYSPFNPNGLQPELRSYLEKIGVKIEEAENAAGLENIISKMEND